MKDFKRGKTRKEHGKKEVEGTRSRDTPEVRTRKHPIVYDHGWRKIEMDDSDVVMYEW